MLYIILRGHRYEISVLNVYAPREEKIGDIVVPHEAGVATPSQLTPWWDTRG
jgi:hypothetical protein